MTAAQTAPTTPDLSWLQGLPEGVSYVALAVIGLGMVLFYLGPGLRARFMPSTATKPDSPAPATPALVPPPALGPAIDQAERLAAEYISFLKGQIDARDRRIDELERDIDFLRRQRGG